MTGLFLYLLNPMGIIIKFDIGFLLATNSRILKKNAKISSSLMIPNYRDELNRKVNPKNSKIRGEIILKIISSKVFT